MKIVFVIATLTTLLAPIQADTRQCAGADPNHDGSGPFTLEGSGFLTADWTQKACAAVGGRINPTKKGNEKCCTFDVSRFGDFNDACDGQTAGNNLRNFEPTSLPC